MRSCKFHRLGIVRAVRNALCSLRLVGRHNSFIIANYVDSFNGVQSLININCILKINNIIYLLRPTPSEVGVLSFVNCLCALNVSCCNVLLCIAPAVPLLMVCAPPDGWACLQGMPILHVKAA
jgi:hypothetical protein